MGRLETEGGCGCLSSGSDAVTAATVTSSKRSIKEIQIRIVRILSECRHEPGRALVLVVGRPVRLKRCIVQFDTRGRLDGIPGIQKDVFQSRRRGNTVSSQIKAVRVDDGGDVCIVLLVRDVAAVGKRRHALAGDEPPRHPILETRYALHKAREIIPHECTIVVDLEAINAHRRLVVNVVGSGLRRVPSEKGKRIRGRLVMERGGKCPVVRKHPIRPYLKLIDAGGVINDDCVTQRVCRIKVTRLPSAVHLRGVEGESQNALGIGANVKFAARHRRVRGILPRALQAKQPI